MAPEAFRADLHLHTSASDGMLSPAAMVRAAEAAGMDVIAITDHDTAWGLNEAMEAARGGGMRVIGGIELSCGSGEEVHVLGYGFKPDDPALADMLKEELTRRRRRTKAMVEKLDRLGMPLDIDEAKSRDTQFVGRLPLADAMVRRGYVASAQEAFERYLDAGRAAFVPRERMPVGRGVERLRSLGAVPVLAHPGRLRMQEGALLALLDEWQDAGLAGMEAYHGSHGAAEALRYDRLARGRGLLVTGGSDSHARPGGAQIGENMIHWRTAREDTAALIRAAESRRQNV